MIGGVKYWIAGWEKPRKDSGELYSSLRFERADEKPITEHDKAKADGYQPQPEDEVIPF